MGGFLYFNVPQTAIPSLTLLDALALKHLEQDYL